MRTQAALNRLLGIILMSLLAGGALLGGSAPAWAEGRVTFTQMSIEQCKGTCTLKLSCGVAGPLTEFISGKQGRTKDLIDIGRSIEIKQFPAEVKCTAAKDTGWIGTTWTEIGSGSVTVPQGGAYKLDIDKAGVGSVRVLLVADSLEILVPTAPAPAAAPAKGKKPAPPTGKGAPLQVAAVLNPDKQGQAVVIGLEWPAFKERVDKWGAQGLKLVDIETFETGGKRLWSGIFKNDPDRVVLRANEEWKDFRTDWMKLTSGRARLVDMEVYDTKPFYAGLFHDFNDRNRPMMWTDERKNFVDKVNELAVEGQQLIDMEVYVGPTKTTYAGTFRATSGKYELWTTLDRAAFEAKWKQAAAKGQQLVDVETYKEGKNWVWDAIARSGMGGPGDLLIGTDLDAFAKRWLEDTGKGLRLVSIELYRQ
jgi:polyglycine hydrolase-like protein